MAKAHHVKTYFVIFGGDRYLIDDDEERAGACAVMRSVVGGNEPAQIYFGYPWSDKEPVETNMLLLSDGRMVARHDFGGTDQYWTVGEWG